MNYLSIQFLILFLIVFPISDNPLQTYFSDIQLSATDYYSITESATLKSLHACSISTNELENLQYLIYIPENVSADMPLIVYLHGASGKGDNLIQLLAADDFPKYLNDGILGKVPAYVIIPQLPYDLKGWRSIYSSLIYLISHTVDEFSIDKNNISLAGYSIGGTAAWNFAVSYPSTFTRIAPICGSAKSVYQKAENLQNMQIQAFVGSDDTIIPPDTSVNMIHILQKNGAYATIRIFDGAEHTDVPSLVWLDKTINLTGWLIGDSVN